MKESSERRMIALQEAQKTYALQYAVIMAVGDDIPTENEIPDNILRIAERYDDFLWNGETGLSEKESTDGGE